MDRLPQQTPPEQPLPIIQLPSPKLTSQETLQPIIFQPSSTKSETKTEIFSWENFAKIIIKRQEEKDSDTVIIIYGNPRTGKTTLGFKILLAYLKLKRQLYGKGKHTWKVEDRWKEHFKKYFSGSAGDMAEKIKNNPEGSYTFVDEGLDILSWHHQMEKEQQDLIELLNKTGKKRQLIIIITPSLKLFTKPMLSRARYLFIIPKEPEVGKNNICYLLKNYDNPILAENHPFGLHQIIDDILKRPSIATPKLFLNYLLGKDRFIGVFRFSKVTDKLYSLYDRLVKEPLIMGEKRKRRVVSYSSYFRLKYALQTLLFRLKIADGKSVKQICNLLIDKFGQNTVSEQVVRNYLEQMEAMLNKPELIGEEPLKEDIDMIKEETEQEQIPDIDIEENINEETTNI